MPRYPNLPTLSSRASVAELARALNEIRDWFLRQGAADAATVLTATERQNLLDHLATTDGNPHGTDHNDTELIQGGAVGAHFHLTSQQEGEVDALTGLTVGIAVKTAGGIWEVRQIAVPPAGLSIANADGTAGDPTLALANDLAAVEGLASAGIAVRTGADTWAVRTLAGTADEVTVTNGSGAGGDPTVGLPTRISGPRRFGAASNHSEFEADGTLKFAGDATVFKDIMFPMAPPKTTGAGNPSLVTYNGNLRGYSFAVGDAHDFDPQEIEHDAKIGSTATFHVHWLSRANDVDERTVKWQIDFDVEPSSGALSAPTTASVEIAIPAATAVNTVQRDNATTFTIPAIARLVGARVTRIASSGTEPSVDPVLRALHFHYELDTVGSRQILTK